MSYLKAKLLKYYLNVKMIMKEIQLLFRRLKIHDTPSARTPDFSLTYLQETVAVDSGKMPFFLIT